MEREQRNVRRRMGRMGRGRRRKIEVRERERARKVRSEMEKMRRRVKRVGRRRKERARDRRLKGRVRIERLRLCRVLLSAFRFSHLFCRLSYSLFLLSYFTPCQCFQSSQSVQSSTRFLRNDLCGKRTGNFWEGNFNFTSIWKANFGFESKWGGE